MFNHYLKLLRLAKNNNYYIYIYMNYLTLKKSLSLINKIKLYIIVYNISLISFSVSADELKII